MNGRQQVFVDIGNSRIKFAWNCSASTGGLRGERCPSGVLRNFCCTSQSVKDFSLPDAGASPTEWVVCSVNRNGANLLQTKIAESRPNDSVRVLTVDDLPIRVQTEFEDEVGVDRLCAGIAANFRCLDTGSSAIYIDSGTAVTINAIDQQGDFLGGVIFPGISTCLKSLRENTSALPYVQFEAPPPENRIIGKNTIEAITNGVYWSNLGAVESIVSRIKRRLSDPPQVFVTGGFGVHLCRQHPRWDWVPYLVLEGVAIAAGSDA